MLQAGNVPKHRPGPRHLTSMRLRKQGLRAALVPLRALLSWFGTKPPFLTKQRGKKFGTIHSLGLNFTFHKIPEMRGRVSMASSVLTLPLDQRDPLDAIAVKCPCIIV